jgi:hypothetical protein
MSLILKTAVTNEVRNQHMELNPVTGLFEPTTLLELATTNLLNTENLRRFIGWTQFSGAVITLTQGQTIGGTPTVAGSPPGEATRIQSTGGTSIIKYLLNVLTRAATPLPEAGSILVRNDGTTNVIIITNGGPPFQPAESNVIPPGATALVRWAGMPAGVGGTSAQIQFQTANAADSLDVLAYGPQYASQNIATSFTGITQTTRATDVFSYDFTLTPQASWYYCKFIEGGTAFGVSSERLWQVGAAAGGNPRMIVFRTANGQYAAQWVDGSGTIRASTPTGGIALGDLVETFVELAGDGVLTAHRRINNGTVASGAASTALALPATWSGPLLHVNSIGTSFAGRNQFFAGRTNGKLVTVHAGVAPGATATERMNYAAAVHG